MSEIMLGLGGNSYVRLVLKSLQAFQGIGVTRLMFSFEVTNKDRSATTAGYPLWLGGRVEVQAKGGNHSYVGRLQPGTAQPINVGPFGQEVGAQLTLDLTNQQFWLIDENRIGDLVHMYMTFAGHAVMDGQYIPIPEAGPLNYQINQSDWLDLIRQSGLKRVILLELDAPDPMTHPQLSEALEYYSQAQTRYREGEWRQSAECIRQSLAALVGKKADEEDQESDVKDALNDAWKNKNHLGYEPRRELVRRAAKFMSDLAAHPDVDETRKADAYAALMITGGLLHAFTRGS